MDVKHDRMLIIANINSHTDVTTYALYHRHFQDGHLFFILTRRTNKQTCQTTVNWGIPIAYMVLYKDILSFAT